MKRKEKTIEGKIRKTKESTEERKSLKLSKNELENVNGGVTRRRRQQEWDGMGLGNVYEKRDD